MKKVNTLEELRAERKRLLIKQAELELVIKADLEDLKEKMEPGHILARATSKLITNNNEGFAGYAVGALTNFIVKKIILRRSGFLTKFAASYVAKNVTTNIFAENKKTILNGIVSLFQKMTKKKSDFPDKVFTNIGYQ